MKKVATLFALLFSLHYVSASTCVDLKENLFRYDENDSVKLLQNFLYENGYLTVAPNGYFGAGTFAAVKAYQKANTISPTGVVGPATRANIKNSSCSGAIETPKLNTNTSTASVSTKSPPLSIKAVCTQIEEGLSIGSETSSVKKMQEYLYAKGYLAAVPNGYYGPGTFAAVKAFQAAKGISQTGTLGPRTRMALKDESCGTVTKNEEKTKVNEQKTEIKVTETKPNSASSSTKVTTITTTENTSKYAETILTNNQKRWRDSEIILKALYQYFVSSRGVWPVGSTSTTPLELCDSPRVTQMASSAEVAVLVTPVSPCSGYIDISYISQSFGNTLPRDPTFSTSSKLLGYTILRNELNEITIAPKVTDSKETIKVRCNFSNECKTITKISGEEFGVPFVTNLSRTLLLRDSLPKSGITVTGRNFASATNTVVLQSKINQRFYNLGAFPSTDGKTFVIPATTTTTEISCGDDCKEKLPIGEYSVQIKNPGGESNVQYITVKSFTTSSISSRADTTVQASSTNVKLGTVTVSTSIPVTLKTLTLRATSTSAKLPGKITNFKLKDPTANKTITASGLTVNLGDTSLSENNSRFYDVYADIGDVLVDEAAQIVYGGTFLVRDVLGGVDVELPMKEITFSVSPQ